jgi:hypothetical protein
MNVIAVVLFAKTLAAQFAFEWVILILGCRRCSCFRYCADALDSTQHRSQVMDQKGNGVSVQDRAAVVDMLLMMLWSQERTSHVYTCSEYFARKPPH